jgi:DNA-binding MarR family transcriptional regulator
MELEKEIQQKKFPSEHNKMVVNIIYTANWINYQQTKFMKAYGISPQQYNLLRILKGQYPNCASINLLIERMLDKMSNASRLVEKLKLKGLVERKVSEKDRRQVDVVITNKGLHLLEEMEVDFKKIYEDYNRVSPEEALELNRILDKLRG